MSALIVIGLIAGVVLVCVLAIMCGLKENPSLTGAVILNTLTGKFWRSAGPGYFIVIPVLEKVAHTVSLVKRSSSVEDDFETARKESVGLTLNLEWEPIYKLLYRLVTFGNGSPDDCLKKVEEMLQKRLLSIANRTVVLYPTTKDVLENLKPIAEKIKSEFENEMTEDGTLKLQEYYGCNLLAVTITKPKLSDELKKAADKKAALKTENEIRDKKLQKTCQMAEKFVKASKKLYPDDPKKWLSFEKALDRVQIDEKTMPKTIQEFEIGNNLGTVLDKSARAILNLIGGKKNG